MKLKYKILYHCIFWAYRVVHLWVFNFFVHQLSWYRGAIVVQVLLSPFFYINYGVLIPALIRKEYLKFSLLTAVWAALFFICYYYWTSHQLHWLYGWDIEKPKLNETLDNIFYIWLISTCFCLFEFWVRNQQRNKELATLRRTHLLMSEENKMMNNFLLSCLEVFEKHPVAVLPDKIMKLSELFKYSMYTCGHPVSLEEELDSLHLFVELTNEKRKRVNFNVSSIDKDVLILATELIIMVHALLIQQADEKVLTVSLEERDNQLILLLDDYVLKDGVHNLFTDSYRVERQLVIPVKQNFQHLASSISTSSYV